MSPFGRRQHEGQRTPEEREAARREREARRAAREGRPLPPPVVEDDAWGDVPESAESDAVAFDGNGHSVEEPRWVDEAPVAKPDDAPWSEPEDAPEPEPAAETQFEPVPEPETFAAPEPAAETQFEPVPEPETFAAPEPVAETRFEPVPEPETFAAPDTEAEAPVAEPEAPAAEEEHPAWDDTGAWETHPPQTPAVEQPTETDAPTLGEEMAAVDRGWFEDETHEPGAPAEETGQETAEWDVLAGKPKERPQPTGPGGIDSPTVEFDVLAKAPKAPVPDRDRDLSGPRPTPPTKRIPSPSRPASFDDAHERPVPTRRVSRARSLPPTPPPPGEKRRGRRGRNTIVVIVLALLLVGVLYLVNALFQPLADDGSGDVQVTIPANSSASDVADILEREGVVDSAFFFEVRTRMASENLQAGTFTLQEGMPYGDAIKALSETPAAPRTVKITIPEGRARRETAPLVRKTGLSGSYLAASEKARGFSSRKYGAPRRAPSLEGFLFPATYELEPDASSRDLVAKQLETFEREIDKVSMRRARQRNLSTYDVLIIASMIDREATLDKERRLVSAVIHNRLREDMPLGIDATIRYATRNWTRPLRQSELAIDSPYNTRRRIGLPPTPIGSPGLASIRAAANPANVDYLYYVVKPNGDGAHNFSSSDAEFQRDVEAYNRERAARGGKDPSSSDGN